MNKPFKPLETIGHAIVAAFWATCVLYSIIELEKGFDAIMCLVLFVCGVCATAQAMLLVNDFEEFVG